MSSGLSKGNKTMGRALTLGQQYWEALQLSRPPSLFSLIECLLRGMKRAFTLKPSSSNLVHASLTTRATGKDITRPTCLWFVSILSALLLLLIFGDQLPLGLACITVMANYQSQLLKLEMWLIGYNMWGWIKEVVSGNCELSENNDSRALESWRYQRICSTGKERSVHCALLGSSASSSLKSLNLPHPHTWNPDFVFQRHSHARKFP